MNFKRSFLIAGSLLVALTLTTFSAFGQGAVPGPEHEHLKKLEGTWNAKVKMMESESAGTVTYKLECGGLWLISDFHGEFGGQKFQGRGMDGYDPDKKKFVSVWVDSMSFRPMISEGTYDKDKKTLSMTGEGPGLDGKPAKFKMQTHMPDDDHQTFTMYVVGADGKEDKIMTIEYTRKK